MESLPERGKKVSTATAAAGHSEWKGHSLNTNVTNSAEVIFIFPETKL